MNSTTWSAAVLTRGALYSAPAAEGGAGEAATWHGRHRPGEEGLSVRPRRWFHRGVQRCTLPADRFQLSLRLAAATPADTSRGLNYTTLFSLIGDHLGREAARKADVLGRGSRADFLSYPIAEYLQTTWNALELLEPIFGGPEAVLTELGRRTITGFLASMIGRTVFAVGAKDPARMLSSAGTSYRAAVSYGERTTALLGPTRARLTFRRDFMPAVFHQAVILAALQAGHAIRPSVVGRDTGLLDSEYDIHWEEAGRGGSGRTAT
jgi:uncharacterized protein (TIGR02265 family)